MAFIPGSIANKFTNTTEPSTGGFIPGSIASKVTSTTQSKSTFVPGSISGGLQKNDFSTLEGLNSYAQKAGLTKEADAIMNPKPKLSALQRLSKGLSALNPAEAILTGKEQGVGTGIKTYVTGAVRDVASAVTGTDYNPHKRFFKDVAEQAGITNGIAKFGIGFVGDVLLDPSTYFGGAIARGLVKGTGRVATTALGGVAKVAPDVATGVKLIGTGLEDAVGSAFKYGYKSSKGASADVATFLSKEQQAKLGLAASNLERLGTGTLTADQSQELALKLIAGKRGEFLAKQLGEVAPAVESADPMVQATINAQKARTAKFADQLGLDNPYETYFPFIKKEKLDNFVKQVGSSNIRVGSEGYLKEFKNVLTNEAIETNPAKAFFTSEAQQVTNRMTSDFLNGFVKKYGKPLTEFSTPEEAVNAGYTLVKDKGFFGKELGYVSKYDGALIKNSLDPGYQAVNMLAKATGFDAVTSLFKRSVTGLFAPFHVRNYLSGHIQNFEALGIDALNPKNISVGQKIAYLMGKDGKIPSGTINVGGKTVKLESVMKPFVDRFSGDTFYNADFASALKDGGELKQMAKTFSKDRLVTTVKTLGIGQEAIPFKVGRAVGQFIEHSQKGTAYVTALNQGKTIQEALDLATHAGFDYRQLTAFESQIMRRLIPFYSFTRKNIGLQLSTLGENPQRVNQVLKFFENNPLNIIGMGGEELTAEEKKNLPDFLKESLGANLKDTPEGLKQIISSFGTPIEAFTQLFGSNPILRTISQMNPLLKAPIEIGIGKDSFRQRDLKDVYDAKEYKLAPQIIKDLLDITEVQKDVLKKNAQGKLIKVGEKTQYVADPVRLLIARSLFTSRGVSYLDQVFGNDMQGFVKVLKTTTGIKPQQVDIQMQESIKNTEKKRAMEDLLSKRAGLSTYQTIYKPKGK